nr:hypothetical protein CFP56_02940 [Quercus suber]
MNFLCKTHVFPAAWLAAVKLLASMAFKCENNIQDMKNFTIRLCKWKTRSAAGGGSLASLLLLRISTIAFMQSDRCLFENPSCSVDVWEYMLLRRASRYFWSHEVVEHRILGCPAGKDGHIIEAFSWAFPGCEGHLTLVSLCCKAFVLPLRCWRSRRKTTTTCGGNAASPVDGGIWLGLSLSRAEALQLHVLNLPYQLPVKDNHNMWRTKPQAFHIRNAPVHLLFAVFYTPISDLPSPASSSPSPLEVFVLKVRPAVYLAITGPGDFYYGVGNLKYVNGARTSDVVRNPRRRLRHLCPSVNQTYC